MFFNYISTLFLVCLMSLPLYAMEEQANTNHAYSVEIIDINSRSQILKNSIQPGSSITIFGATPKISRFEQYNTVLQEHLSNLQTYSEKNRLLKGVDRIVKNAFNNLRKEYNQNKTSGQNNIIEFLAKRSLVQQYHHFFTFGFNQDLLKDNSNQLIKQSSDADYLVHLLLPCYFGEIREKFKNNTITYEQLHQFLQASAQFYKKNYAEIIKNTSIAKPPHIRIVIPHLDEFKTFIDSDVDSREESIIAMATTLSGFINQLSEGKTNTYTLIDQDYQEADLIAQIAYNLTSTLKLDKPVESKVLVLHDNRFKQTVIFNPYILKSEGEKQTPYQHSPLVTQELCKYLTKEQQIPKESYESQS